MESGIPATAPASGTTGSGGARGPIGVLAEEPFRWFFPAGLAASMAGVALWPMFYAGWLGFAPGVCHARIMIECFAGAFIVGFLGTALPPMMGLPRLTRGEFVLLAAIHAAVLASLMTGHVAAGDGLFLAWLSLFAGGMAFRVAVWPARRPAPPLLLAFAGILGALGAMPLLLAEWIVPVSGFARNLANLLLYQGFVLLPILGVGAVVLPLIARGEPEPCRNRLGAGGGRPGVEGNKGVGSVAVVWACGGVFLGSLVLEAAGWIVIGSALRAAAVAVVLARDVLLARPFRGRGSLSFAARTAGWCIVLGLAAVALFPYQRVGVLHLVFVSGFGLLVLAVGGRVILRHAGRPDLFGSKRRIIGSIVFLAVLAALTRASADFVPKIMVTHHIYAAASWAILAGLWMWWARAFLPAGGGPTGTGAGRVRD